MIQDPKLQQKVIATLQDPDPTVCQPAAIAIDHLETHLLESLKSPATPMTQADWDHIRHTVRQNLLK
jgi:phosphodiesterase/alkaline phosphatase D-like protein